MIKNAILLALRTMNSNRVYTFINLSGLAMGITCFILMSLWVTDELRYDTFHTNIDRLYRVNTVQANGRIIPNSSLKLGHELNLRYPEILAYSNHFRLGTTLLRYQDKSFEESSIYLVDQDFFTMFTFDFVAGNPSTALPEPSSLVLTDETAKKIFGDGDPIGRRISSDVFQRDFVVTAVVKKMPANSTLQFALVASINLMPLQRRESWEYSGWTYVQLKDGVSEDRFNQKIQNFYSEYVNRAWTVVPRLQRFATLHLYETGEAGMVKLVYILSAIAVFILILAYANYTNLSTARATRRALEVGVRKANGAGRRHLIFQFLIESIFAAGMATVLAVILVELILPSFNTFTYKNLTFTGSGFLKVLAVIVGVSVFSGVVAGFYPAFVLSSVKPISALRGEMGNFLTEGATFRKLLTIGQFFVASVLIIATLQVGQQLNFLRTASLGMDRTLVLTMQNNVELMKNFDAFEAELTSSTAIASISASATQPFDVNQAIPINWEGHMTEQATVMRYSMSDYDFMETLGMEIVQGREFSRDIASDSTEAVIINESAASLMGFKDPVGKAVYFGHPAFPEEKRQTRIIGVVKDFHFRSLHHPMGPFVFRMHRPWHFNIFIKLKPGALEPALSALERVTKKYAPAYSFNYEFLDDTYDRLYIMETKAGQIVDVFALFAIVISCLGLFGLASYTAAQRTKEVGIRKVLGASTGTIFLLLSKEFLKWVFIATVAAWPIAYYLMDQWLRGFSFRVAIDWWIFILSAGIALFAALATVSVQTLKTARSNPVESLKYQ